MVVFEQSRLFERTGRAIGYLFAYFMFTAILYLVLYAAKKLPHSWSCLHIAGITAIIAFAGAMMKRYLK